MKNFNTFRFRALFFLLVTFFLFLNTLNLRAQILNPTGNVFQDTEGLKMSIEQKKGDMIIKYLKTMGLPTDKTLLQNNSYLKEFFTDDLFAGVGILAIDPANVTAITTSGGVFDALLPPTQTIDALGTFIAKRFREEINIAYLAKFQAFLNDAKNQEIRLLFPKTTDVFGKVEPYNYTTFLETLRQAFEKDLEMLPQNTAEVMRSPKITIKNPDVKNALILFLVMTQEIINGGNVIKVLGGLDLQPEVDLLSTAPQKYLRLTSVIIRNSYYKRTTNYELVEIETIEKIIRNEQLQKLCIGLLMEKERAALDKIDTVIYNTLAKAGEIEKILKDIRNVAIDLDAAKSLAASIKNARSNGQSATDDFFKYTENFISILQSSVSLTQKLTGANSTTIQELNNFLTIGQTAFATTRFIYEKKYGLALMNSVQLLDEALSSSPTKTQIIKYGTFMVTMANAKSSEEMVKALESAALPVGSYRIKRNNFFNVSINSYGGGFAGKEYIHYQQENPLEPVNVNRDGFTFGPSAPIGLFVGWGRSQDKIDVKTCGKKPYSFGFFMSLIDVGAVFAFRLEPNNVATLPELKWKNVFAPGLHAVWSPFKGPLSVSLGYQRGPELRKITLTDNTPSSVISAKANRLSLTLTCDIPLFNIYTKANKVE